jgi:hypothetical protein
LINIFISFSIIIHYEIHRIFTLLLRPHSTHKFFSVIFIIKHFCWIQLAEMEIFILGVFVSRIAYTIPGLAVLMTKLSLLISQKSWDCIQGWPSFVHIERSRHSSIKNNSFALMWQSLFLSWNNKQINFFVWHPR